MELDFPNFMVITAKQDLENMNNFSCKYRNLQEIIVEPFSTEFRGLHTYVVLLFLFWIRASLMSPLQTKRASGVNTKLNPGIYDEFIQFNRKYLPILKISLYQSFLIPIPNLLKLKISITNTFCRISILTPSSLNLLIAPVIVHISHIIQLTMLR